MKKLLVLAQIILLLSSCQTSSDRNLTEPVPSNQAIFIPPAKTVNDPNTQKITVATPSAAAPATVPAPKSNVQNSGTVGVNPAHGAPGHRCDIAVGAPLNTPATTGAQPVKNITPTPTPAPALTQAPATPADKNVRLNPAHGAPGHDCAIPVGQPLKN